MSNNTTGEKILTLITCGLCSWIHDDRKHQPDMNASSCGIGRSSTAAAAAATTTPKPNTTTTHISSSYSWREAVSLRAMQKSSFCGRRCSSCRSKQLSAITTPSGSECS